MTDQKSEAGFKGCHLTEPRGERAGVLTFLPHPVSGGRSPLLAVLAPAKTVKGGRIGRELGSPQQPPSFSFNFHFSGGEVGIEFSSFQGIENLRVNRGWSSGQKLIYFLSINEAQVRSALSYFSPSRTSICQRERPSDFHGCKLILTTACVTMIEQCTIL